MGKEKMNINIGGSGIYPGGEFNIVKISGSGVINGDLKCESCITSGSSKLSGNVNSNIIKVSGSSRIEGNVISEELTVNGSCKIHGNAIGNTIKINGSSSIKGNLRGNDVLVAGSLHVDDDIETEDLRVFGTIKHNKFINAERIIIDTSDKCSISSFNEIGATLVSINKRENKGLIKKFLSLFNSNSSKIEGNAIEADYITINNTVVNQVKGDNIEIGPDCHISYLEYTNKLSIHDSSVVKEIKKIDKMG